MSKFINTLIFNHHKTKSEHKIGMNSARNNVYERKNIRNVAVKVQTLPYRPTPYRCYRYSNGQRFRVYWLYWGDKLLYIIYKAGQL